MYYCVTSRRTEQQDLLPLANYNLDTLPFPPSGKQIKIIMTLWHKKGLKT